MVLGRNVKRYYLKYIHLFLLGIIALVFVDIYQLNIPEIIGNIIDGIEDLSLTEMILFSYIKELILIVLIMLVGRFLWRVTVFGSAIKIEADMRERMFVHAEKLSQSYYQENKIGAMMALFTNDLQAIRHGFASGTIMLIDVLVLGSLSLYKMIKIDVVMTSFAAIPLLLVAVSGAILVKYMRKKFEARQKSFSELTDFTQESFSGISVIKAYVKEAKELLAFSKRNKDYLEKNVEFVKMATILQITIEALVMTVIIVIIGYGGFLVYKNKITIGTLTAYITYFTTLVWPMMAIAQMLNIQSQTKASLKRINAHLDHEVEIKDATDIIENLEIGGNIRFDNLNFSYPKSDLVALKDLSFSLKNGESLGIIGRTGSGKTTIVDLLMRVYNVGDGMIFIDDVDINKIPIKTIREHIAYVPQDGFLFSDTIANNIDFAANTNDVALIKEAARLADVAGNIEEFSLGYETVLGERGVTVSGGQKQRISIARALLKDANILILDDAVSSVDTKTEETILKNLKKIRKNKTTIVIAHRITTVSSLDKILVIDEGRLVAFGSHEELIKESPIYANMVKLQKLEDEVEGL